MAANAGSHVNSPTAVTNNEAVGSGLTLDIGNTSEYVGDFKWVLEAQALCDHEVLPCHDEAKSNSGMGVRPFHKEDFVVFVSHRWQSDTHPDPEHTHAKTLALLIRSALDTASSGVKSSTIFSVLDKQLGGHLWLQSGDHKRLDPFTALTRRIEGNLAAGRPGLDHIVLWVDWCCLPQRHRAVPSELRQLELEQVRYSAAYRCFRAQRKRLALGLEWAVNMVLEWPAVALVDAKYSTRAWCVVEALLSRVGRHGMFCVPSTHDSVSVLDGLEPSLLATTDEFRQSPTALHPHTLLNAWKDKLQSADAFGMEILANFSYAVLAEHNSTGRELSVCYFLLVPLLGALGVFSGGTQLALVWALSFLLVFFAATTTAVRLVAWMPHALLNQWSASMELRKKQWLLRTCAAATTSALLQCHTCRAGCPRCMSYLASALPPAKPAGPHRLGWTAALACTGACVCAGFGLQMFLDLSPQSFGVLLCGRVLPCVFAGLVLYQRLIAGPSSVRLNSPHVTRLLATAQLSFECGRVHSAMSQFADALRVAIDGAAPTTPPGWGQAARPGEAEMVRRAAQLFRQGCVCGKPQSANCAHYLTNALIAAGFTDLDQGCGANHRVANGYCVCPSGRPVRARETHEWFRQHGRRISREDMKLGRVYGVYQEKGNWIRNGHVLLKWVDGFAGTCELPDWPHQFVYEFME